MKSHAERQKFFRDQRAEWKRSGVVTRVKIVASSKVEVCADCKRFDGKSYPLRRAPEMPLHEDCHCEMVAITEN